MLEFKSLVKLDKKAIESQVATLRKELFSLKIQKVTLGLQKSHVVKEKRKDIARLLTAKNRKK